MGYCTDAQVRAELGQNADTTYKITTTVYSAARMTDRINQVTGLINSYVGNIYTIPFSTTPPLIEKICMEIVCYLVLRAVYGADSRLANGWVNVYNNHMGMVTKDGKRVPGTLQRIHDGQLQVFNSSGVEVARNGNLVDSNHGSYHPTFDVDEPENWSQDAQKLDEIADARDAD